MSSQFYDYIANRLEDFFKKISLKGGERYFLQLEEQDQIDSLYAALRNLSSAEPFIFKHESGAVYKSFSLKLKSHRIVVARTNEKVSPDFLVTLRNRVGEQEGIWKGTALLSICTEHLDSIQGGSTDLQKEGMPLHVRTLIPSLEREIRERLNTVADQSVAQFYLEQLKEDIITHQTSFLDFEDLLEILHKQKVEERDYYKLHLFKDSEIDQFSNKTTAMNRLKENHRLFEEVLRCHEYSGEIKEELEETFTESGANILSKDDWQNLDFKRVYLWHTEKIEQQKESNLEFQNLTCKDKGNEQEKVIWEKPRTETKAGKRKRHIIIFNPKGYQELELKSNFKLIGTKDKMLKEKFIKTKKPKSATVTVSGRNLVISLTCNAQEVTFERVVYKHDDETALSCELNIAVIPVEPAVLESIKTNYRINVSNKRIETDLDTDDFIIGNEQGFLVNHSVDKANQQILISEDEYAVIRPDPEAFDDKNRLPIDIQVNQILIPLRLINSENHKIPITGLRIWKMKREEGKSFTLSNHRLILGNNEYYPHSDDKRFFEWEFQWINEGMKFARISGDQLEPESLELESRLEAAYSRFITYFSHKGNIPTLSFMDEELKGIAQDYVATYISLIEEINDGDSLIPEQRNLFKLGVLRDRDSIYFTPFHPLVVAYQITINEELGREVVENHLLERLTPDNLLPYLYDDHNQLYKPYGKVGLCEWLLYKPNPLVTVSDAKHYVAKVVEEKIKQFQHHFSYLFPRGSQAPLCLNVINITNDEEVLKGVVNWIVEQLSSVGPDQIQPVEVALYFDKSIESAFEVFSRMDSVEEIKKTFGVNLNINQYDEESILRVVRSRLKYYKLNLNDSYRYAHISFYKMKAEEKESKALMEKLTTGLSLKGLISTTSTMSGEEDYRTGFGLKHYKAQDSLLVRLASGMNELASNMKDQGSSPYRKGESIITRIPVEDELSLDKLYEMSHWVTFVNPNVDLDFFHSDRNLIVIHYSDQYTSSSRYDAVTITAKIDQYFAVIREFLEQKEVPVEYQHIRNAVKSFNAFNGEWLLRVIGSKSQYPREKLSVISAIKHSLAYFDHPRITWVPISLEEILRIAGAAKLNQRAGIFSIKNLKRSGSHSDDLLLIGVEDNGENLKLHFYPIEVKIGKNQSHVMQKAKEQVLRTYQVIKEQLVGKEDLSSFNRNFYRNFFIQLLLSNAKKMTLNEIWPEKNYDLRETVYEKLLKGEYEISDELQSFIGKGAILSYEEGNIFSSAVIENDVLVLKLTEEDGYKGIVESIEEIKNGIQQGRKDFETEKLIFSMYKGNPVSSDVSVDQDMISANSIAEKNEPSTFYVGMKDDSDQELIPSEEKSSVAVIQKEPVDKIRVLIGEAEGSTKKIYWEYGHSDLANRHLLISGRSGQGKTYFMQCMLLELAKQGITSVVIDYTDGFTNNQLEQLFKKQLGNKLQQVYVKQFGFPMNPFKRNERELDEGFYVKEDETDVAERIRSVFAAVYPSLGIQQLNAIYQATMSGLRKYQEKMSLQYLRTELELDNSSYARTALAQLAPLIDRDPFRSADQQNWGEILKEDGLVYIIQLTQYPRDVQLLITEFILWDLWNYSVEYGEKDFPIPVVMDEAQNLDHSQDSPSARILTEGRKHGWSGWYATQFLKSQLSADELARLQNASLKVYFSPPETELKTLASSLSQDPLERKEWERKLADLKKGQCIVYGPILQQDGSLSRTSPIIVNISSLQERI